MVNRVTAAIVIGLWAGSAYAEGFTAALYVLSALAVQWAITNAVTIAFVAYALYSGAQARKKKKRDAETARAEALSNLQDRTANILSTEAPFQIIYGSPAPVGGTIAAVLSSGANDEFKHVVIVFAAHEITAFTDFYIDGVRVPLDANGNANGGEFYEVGVPTLIQENISFNSAGVGTATKPVTGFASSQAIENYFDGKGLNQRTVYAYTNGGTTWYSTPNKVLWVNYTYQIINSWVTITKHLGTIPDTWDSRLGSLVPEWTPAHKISGKAYAVVSLNLNHPRFLNPVKITAKIRGKKVKNLQTGVVEYSNNPAYCAADFLTSNYGFRASPGQIDVNSFISAATTCAQAVYLSSFAQAVTYGTQRYTCDGSFTTDQDRESVLTQLEDCFAGQIFRSGGVWRISPGAWAVPIKTLNPKDAAAPLQIKQASFSTRARYNVVKGSYIDSEGLGTPIDYPSYKNGALIALDGQEKETNKSFVFVNSALRCRDLARIEVEKSRGGLIVDFPAQFSAWPLQPGDRVWVNDPTYGFVNKTFRITDWVQNPKAPITLQMVEDVPSIYDFVDEVLSDPSPNTSFRNPYLRPSPPSGLSAESGTSVIEILADGTLLSRTKLSWVPSTDPYVLGSGGNTLLRVRSAAGDGGWSSYILVSPDTPYYYFDTLVDGKNYVFEVSFRNGVGATSFAATIQATQLGKSEPPSDVTGFSLTLTNSGVIASCVANTDADHDYWYLKAGSVWNTATDTLPGSGNTPVQRKTTTYPLGWLPAGTNYVVSKNVDTSGNQSLNAATASITTLAPLAPQFKDVKVEQNKCNFQWFDAKTSQPILRYEYRVAKVINGVVQAFDSRGSSGSDSRSDNIPFFEAAKWRLEITAVDVAGNRGPSNYTDFDISLPNDYQPLLSSTSTGAGTLVNAVKTGLFNRVTFPVNATETYGAHFTSRGWNSAQDQINAGFPLYFQPGATSGSYTEDIDIGVVFTSGTITLNLSVNTLAGTPGVSYQILYKRLIGDAYTAASLNSNNVIATNFRYVRIVVTVDSPLGKDLAEIELLQVNINVVKISETATVNCSASDVNGTLYTTTRGFTDVQGVVFDGLDLGANIRAEKRIVDVGAPGVPAQVFVYLFAAGTNTRVNGSQFITIYGV